VAWLALPFLMVKNRLREKLESAARPADENKVQAQQPG
jgi:hypothetical protein